MASSHNPSNTPYHWVSTVCVLPGIALFVASPCILVAQCLYWVRYASWPNWTPIAFGGRPPVTPLLGINEVITWFYDRQIWLLCIFAGVFVFFAGAEVIGELERKQAQRQMR